MLPLYNNTRWGMHTFTELSLSLSALLANTNYDIFARLSGYLSIDSPGSPVLEAVAWTAPTNAAITGVTNASPPVVTSNAHGRSNDQIVTITGVLGATGANGTWRVMNVAANTFELHNFDGSNVAAPGVYTSGGTWQLVTEVGTRVTALGVQDGVDVLSGFPTKRYLGTIRITNTAGQCEDSSTKRFVWNRYNRVPRRATKSDSNSHVYSTATVRPWNNDVAIRVEVVVGQQLDAALAGVQGRVLATAAGDQTQISFGFDATAAVASAVFENRNTQAVRASIFQDLNTAAGYHFLQVVERSVSGGGTYDLGVVDAILNM